MDITGKEMRPDVVTKAKYTALQPRAAHTCLILEGTARRLLTQREMLAMCSAYVKSRTSPSPSSLELEFNPDIIVPAARQSCI